MGHESFDPIPIYEWDDRRLKSEGKKIRIGCGSLVFPERLRLRNGAGLFGGNDYAPMGSQNQDQITASESLFGVFANEDHGLLLDPDFSITDSSGMLKHWTFAKWGNNNSAKAYHSADGVKIVYQGSDGDAKMVPEKVVPFKAKTKYTYNETYRSDVATAIIAEVTDANGKTSYPVLQDLPPVSEFTEIGVPINLTADTKSFAPMHIINHPGSLEIRHADVGTDLSNSAGPAGSASQTLTASEQMVRGFINDDKQKRQPVDITKTNPQDPSVMEGASMANWNGRTADNNEGSMLNTNREQQAIEDEEAAYWNSLFPQPHEDQFKKSMKKDSLNAPIMLREPSF